MNDDPKPFLPLSPAALHILVCLAGEARHGYGIMQDVIRQSNGHYKLGPGTLYDNLQKLMNQGLVEEARRKIKDDDPRRRYYGLTGLGRSVLEADIERLKNVVREANLRLKPAASGGSR
jgi:DNA-binding PadR family transcriptional regulator